MRNARRAEIVIRLLGHQRAVAQQQRPHHIGLIPEQRVHARRQTRAQAINRAHDSPSLGQNRRLYRRRGTRHRNAAAPQVRPKIEPAGIVLPVGHLDVHARRANPLPVGEPAQRVRSVHIQPQAAIERRTVQRHVGQRQHRAHLDRLHGRNGGYRTLHLIFSRFQILRKPPAQSGVSGKAAQNRRQQYAKRAPSMRAQTKYTPDSQKQRPERKPYDARDPRILRQHAARARRQRRAYQCAPRSEPRDAPIRADASPLQPAVHRGKPGALRRAAPPRRILATDA